MNDKPAKLTQAPEGYADWLTDLKYMRALVEAWPNSEFVQEVAAQLPWGHAE